VELLEEFEKENPDCNILYMMFRNAENFEIKNKKKSQRKIFCEGKWKIFWTIEEYFSFEIESSKLIN